MKIRTIAENKFTDLAQKLTDNLHQMGKSELEGIVVDPETTVKLIQDGSKFGQYILSNKRWLQSFIPQWHLLEEQTILNIVEQVHKETMEKHSQLQGKSQDQNKSNTYEELFRNEEILAEGIGGFLLQLFKWTVLMIHLIAAVSGYGGKGGYGRYGGREATDRDLRILNPYAVYHLTRNLYQASLAAK